MSNPTTKELLALEAELARELAQLPATVEDTPIGRPASPFRATDMAPAINQNPQSIAEIIKAVSLKEKAGYQLDSTERLVTMDFNGDNDYSYEELFGEPNDIDLSVAFDDNPWN